MMTTVTLRSSPSHSAEELQNTFESVSRAHVDLLGLRDFFKNFLNHDSIVVSNFTVWESHQFYGTPHLCAWVVRTLA